MNEPTQELLIEAYETLKFISKMMDEPPDVDEESSLDTVDITEAYETGWYDGVTWGRWEVVRCAKDFFPSTTFKGET